MNWRKYEWILPLLLIILVVSMSYPIARGMIWLVETLLGRFAPSLLETKFR